MDKDNIKNELDRVITEAAVSGEKITKKAQKVSKEENDAYYKDVEKKMSEYDKDLKTEDEDAIDPKKVNIDGDDKEYHDEMEIRNGQEMLNYDNDPGEVFTDRALKAIEGDSTMGNKTYTGDENGNTEPVWGASDAEFGKKLVDTIKSSKKKRDDGTPARHQFGDDIEVAKGDPAVKSKKNAIGEGMKRIKFKKAFNGVQNAINLIPEAFKVENKKFELTDGNENYLVEWKDNHANILTASDDNMLSESFNKIKHLMGFKVGSDSGSLDANARVNENRRLFENATGVAFGSQGNGFTNEDHRDDEFYDPSYDDPYEEASEHWEDDGDEKVDETASDSGFGKWGKKEWAPGEEEEMDASVKASGDRWEAKRKEKLNKQYANLGKNKKQ